jgi:GntR family transcriptional regulator, transcriptional repressor for pyruvate dehydrogenase complex
MAERREAARKDPVLSATLRQTVEALRAEALQCPEGALIGSEDDLLGRHHVSRPTLRQAAALLAQEQLLQVRRGVKGGYIARRPTSRAVAHMASIYLRSRDASIDELSSSTTPIRAELARLAAENLDEASHEAFEAFLKHEAVDDIGDFKAFARSEREFGRLLGAASHNHVLSLFLDILYDLAASIPHETDIFLGWPERIIAYRQQRTRLVEAILDGDPSVAALLALRTSQLVHSWREEDLGRDPSLVTR